LMPHPPMGWDIDSKETGIWKSIFWMFIAE
jgi:hypothetical protein